MFETLFQVHNSLSEGKKLLKIDDVSLNSEWPFMAIRLQKQMHIFFISCPNWIWVLRILSFFPYAKSQENCMNSEWLDSSIE